MGTKNVFATVNNTGTFSSVPARVPYEPTLQQWIRDRGLSPLKSFVVSGSALSDGGGTTVNIAIGVHIIEGYYCQLTSSSDNVGGFTGTNTWYVFAQLDISGGFVTTSGWTYVVQTSTTAPSNSVFLGRVRTTAGAKSSILNAALGPHSPYKGSDVPGTSGEDAGRVFLGWRPKYVQIGRRVAIGSSTIFSISGVEATTQTGLALGNVTAAASTSTATRGLIQFDGFDVSGGAAGELLVTGATYDYLAWA